MNNFHKTFGCRTKFRTLKFRSLTRSLGTVSTSNRLDGSVRCDKYLQFMMQKINADGKFGTPDSEKYKNELVKLDEKHLKRCETINTAELTKMASMLLLAYGGAGVGLVYYGSFAAAELMIWGLSISAVAAWAALNVGFRRSSQVQGIYFNPTSKQLSFLINAPIASSKPSPNIFINISPEFEQFELFTDGAEVAKSDFLLQPQNKLVDRYLFKVIKPEGLVNFKDPMAAYIVFDKGLEMSSPFGPLPPFLLGLPNNLLKSAMEEFRENPEIHKSSSVIVKKILDQVKL